MTCYFWGVIIPRLYYPDYTLYIPKSNKVWRASILLLATVRCKAVLPSVLFRKSTIAPPLTRAINILEDLDLTFTAKLRGVSEKKLRKKLISRVFLFCFYKEIFRFYLNGVLVKFRCRKIDFTSFFFCLLNSILYPKDLSYTALISRFFC